MKLTVVPAVHLEAAALPDYPEGGAARDALKTLAREFGDVYIVDVQGVRRNKPDLEFLRDGTRNLPVWVDTGSRYATDAMDALVAGASRVTLRWNTLASRAELEELAEMGDAGTFLLGLEFTEKGFLPHPRELAADPEALAREVAGLGVGVVVQSTRFDPTLARRLADPEGDRWWYGPVTRDDAVELRRLGYKGVIVPAATARDLGPMEGPTEEDGG